MLKWTKSEAHFPLKWAEFPGQPGLWPGLWLSLGLSECSGAGCYVVMLDLNVGHARDCSGNLRGVVAHVPDFFVYAHNSRKANHFRAYLCLSLSVKYFWEDIAIMFTFIYNSFITQQPAAIC